MSVQDRKVAVVTGASQGIGAGLVEGYRELGYAVVATSREHRRVRGPGRGHGPGGHHRTGDRRRVIATAVERFGRVDTLVNNAGIFVAKPFTEYTEEDYRDVLGVNLDGFFHITQLAVRADAGAGRRPRRPDLQQPGGPAGREGDIGARVTHEGWPAVGDEGAGDRVRDPGDPCQRGGAGHDQDPDAPAWRRTSALPELHPVGRMGEMDDIVEAVLYLERAPFVTGVILPSTAARPRVADRPGR